MGMINKDILDLLCKDHNNRFTEMRDHMSRYNNQVSVVYIYISIIAAFLTYLFSKDSGGVFGAFSPESAKYACGILLIFVSTILYYLVASMMDALFMTYANGVRMACIERNINNIFGENIWVWDAKIINEIHGVDSWYYKGWIKPNYVLAVWIALLIILATIVLIVVWQVFVESYTFVYAVIMLSVLAFHISQWYFLQTQAVAYLNKVSEKAISSSGNPKKKGLVGLKNPLTVFIMTVVFGFVPQLVISIYLRAFWYDSIYDYPLMMIPSVFLGDAFILPVLNYFIIKFYNQYSSQLKNKRVLVTTFVLISLIVSFLLNLWLHSRWVSDAYLGFMDIEYGSLSAAGWWHFWVSVFEMSFVLSFLIFFFYLNHRKTVGIYKSASALSVIIFFFCSLGIVDLIVKIFCGDNFGIFFVFKRDFYSLIPLVFSALFLFFVKRKIRFENDNVFYSSLNNFRMP